MTQYSNASTYSKPDIAYMKAHVADNESPNYIAACAIGTSLACLAVALRFASRRIAHNPLKTDDWLLLVALTLVMGFVAADVFTIYYGMGKHIIYVRSFKGLVQSTLAAEVLSALSFVPIKISVLFLYTRLFGWNVLKPVAIGMGAFITLYSLAQIVATVLQCSPLDALWTGEIQGNCINMNLMFTVFSCLNVLTNTALLLIPVPFLWRQELFSSKRPQLLSLFVLGSCVCASSVTQAYFSYNIITYDPSWNNTYARIWSVIDLCFTLIVACLPTFGTLLSRQARQGDAPKKDLSSEFRESASVEDLKPDWFKLEVDIDSSNSFAGLSDEKRSGSTGDGHAPSVAV